MDLIDIGYFISFYIMLYCSFIWLYVYLRNRETIKTNPVIKRSPLVSFIVPAYNEEANIENCIKSIMNVRYPKKDITVVDDGSTDNTEKICKKYQRKGLIKFIKQNHGGKAAAMNNGIMHVRGTFIASMDADSYPDPDYLNNTMGYFNNPIVSVVTPSLKVIQTDSILRKIQWVEYLFSIFLRKLFSIFDCQYVAPGPGSIYRKDKLRKIGSFATDNLTEDMEIAFRFYEKGHKIENSTNAYVYTHTPRNFGSLYKQRIRWYRGYLQNTKKYSHMILSIRHGNLGFFLLPVNLAWIGIMSFMFINLVYNTILSIYNFIKPAWIVNDIGTLINFEQIEINWFYIFDFYSFFFVLFFVLGLLTIKFAVSTSGEKLEVWKRKTFYLYFIVLYPLILSFFWIMSTIKELIGDKRIW